MQAVAVDEVVDTTAAGDKLRGGLPRRPAPGRAAAAAARAGHDLAGLVVRYPGAIVPRAAMSKREEM